MRDSRDKKENLAPKRPAPKKGKRKFVIAAHDFLPRVRESFNAVSPLVHTWGHVLENLPTIFLLWFLWLHSESIAVGANLILETSDDTDWKFFLLTAKAVSSTDHLGALHGLSMPVVAVETALQMGVTLSLKQIVVVTLLGEEVHVVVLAVVANLLDHGTDSCLVFPDQFGVLGLLTLQDLYEASLLGKGAFEFRNTSSYRGQLSSNLPLRHRRKLTTDFSVDLLQGWASTFGIGASLC